VILHFVAERSKIETLEQGFAAAEQNGRYRNVHLVDEPRLEILADGGGAAADPRAARRIARGWRNNTPRLMTISRHVVAIAAMPALLAGCGTDRNSPDPAASTAAPASQSPYVGQPLPGLTPELHVAISPILLGRGEPLFEGLDLRTLGYEVKDHVATGAAMHLVVGR
jgi:hypothetical protein